MKKRILSVLLVLALSSGYSMQVFATTAEEVREEQEKTEEQLNTLNEQMETMEGRREAVAGEITVLDTELVDILTSISICEDEIAAKEDEIDIVKEELEEAKEREATQYEDMKTRIRFMYERGEQAYLQLFLEASNFSEMLNKASYVEKLYEYDRELLLEYEATKQEIASIKEELELEEADLLISQRELKEQKDYLEILIAEKRATVADFDTQLAQARQEVTSYKNLLKEQNEQIRRLEKEEREKREKEKEKEKQDQNNDTFLASAAQDDGNNDLQNIGVTQQPESGNDGDSLPSVGNGDDGPSPGSGGGGSGLGQQIANYGCQFIGNPYVYGGTSLTNGTDCSGFTKGVYAHFGITLPRDSTSQRFAGRGVSYEEARPGDIICYAGHVGIYIGNGQIVHASTERTGIKISNATYRTILAVRRIVD